MYQNDEGWDQAGPLGKKYGRIRIGEAHHTDCFDNRDVELADLTSARNLPRSVGHTSAREQSGRGCAKYLLALSTRGRSILVFR
jgi:hypothetical protein